MNSDVLVQRLAAIKAATNDDIAAMLLDDLIQDCPKNTSCPLHSNTLQASMGKVDMLKICPRCGALYLPDMQVKIQEGVVN